MSDVRVLICYSLDIEYHRGAGLLLVLLVIVEQDFLAADHNILQDNKGTQVKSCHHQRPVLNIAPASPTQAQRGNSSTATLSNVKTWQ